MRFNSKSITIVCSVAALSLGMFGCHGQYSGTTGYMPPSTNAIPASQSGGGIERTAKKKVKIQSGCGHRLHIVIAGIVNCRFREEGYGNGIFTVTNHETGIIGVTPSSGDKSTVFTIVGLVLGSGHLVWKDSKGREYKIAVRVTL